MFTPNWKIKKKKIVVVSDVYTNVIAWYVYIFLIIAGNFEVEDL